MASHQPMPKPGLQDMNDRRLFLQQNIATVEDSLRALMHQRGQIPDNTFSSKLLQLQTDLKQKSELLHRFTQFVMSSQQMDSDGLHPGPNNMENVVSNGIVQMSTPSILTMTASMDSIQVPPLDPMRFEMMYRQFCANQEQEFRLTAPMNDRSVELHQLHRQVMTANGLGNVDARNLWPVIGGRLGLVQFPGNDRQPPRCGPMIAQQLRHIYRETLHSFDQTYSLSWQNRHNGGSNNGTDNDGNAPSTPAQQLAVSSTDDNQANANRIPDNRQLAMLALRFGASTVEEMRSQGVPPHIINFVETKRPLMAFIRQQHERRMVQGNANGGLVPAAADTGGSDTIGALVDHLEGLDMGEKS